jgi:cation-transporting ATPase 13A2
MDEVLHPFYIFQIFSIGLWTVDDYYCALRSFPLSRCLVETDGDRCSPRADYAFAIAVISVASIISTLLETRANVQRMREMSRFSCEVRILRDSECALLIFSLLFALHADLSHDL